MYNILINNLSLVTSTTINTYELITNNTASQLRSTRTFYGIYTNEPVTQVFIRKFANEERGEKLNAILSLASVKVKENIFDIKKQNQTSQTFKSIENLAKYLDVSLEQAKYLTHYSFYETTIRKMVAEEYLLETDEEIDAVKPVLDSVPIPNIPEATDIQKAVIDLAEKIINLYNTHPEGCRLYMDYTGGDRSTSTIIIALTKMLENRGIHITQILAVNFDRDAPVKEIRSKIEVNHIFDFISGLHEFNHYGRAQMLAEFLDRNWSSSTISQSVQAKTVLNKISYVSDQIQMCRSSKIVSSIGELANAIDDYEKNDTVHDPIFDYLIQDIKGNYVGIYKKQHRTVLNIIRWCLQKNLIQQAVTMYAELLPQELVDQHILEYDRSQWNDKTAVTQKVFDYKNEVHNYWINGVATYGHIQADKSIRNGSNSKYSEKYAYINYYIGYEIANRASCSQDTMGETKVRKIVDYIFSVPSPYTKVKPGITKKQLIDILLNYWQFKKLIRHVLNHASSGSINIGEIRAKMNWTNEEAIFLESDRTQIPYITVATLSAIITDLLDQLESAGMR